MTTEAESAGMPGTGEITRLLEEMREGDPEAAEELLSHVYRELRALAAAKMAHEAPGQTLQPTALVHEAWLRLGGGEGARFPDRAYFFAAAGEAMRRILVEIARRKKRLKHGGNLERVDIENVELAAPLPDDELLAVDEALTRLAESEPRAAELVKLLLFRRIDPGTSRQRTRYLRRPPSSASGPSPARGSFERSRKGKRVESHVTTTLPSP